MKATYTSLILFIVLVISGCSESQYESIFNGEDLSGWVVKCAAIDADKEYWYVEDQCLVANSMGDSVHDYMWLQYDNPVQNYSLKFKFQPLKGNTGNTGIQVRSFYDEETEWLNGPQIDIHPFGPWRTGMIWDETRGYQRWIFPDLPDGVWVNPEMAISEAPFYYKGDSLEWNDMEVKVEGNSIKAWVNGTMVTDYDGSAMLGDSLHSLKNCGSEGYILLQIHMKDQLEIRFRDIQLLTKQ